MATDNTYWRDPALGSARTIELPAGSMRVFESGEGPAIVFVHGAFVNPNLWRKVVPALSARFRCICLEMPLGSHEIPMPGADRTGTGLADLIADAIGALGLEAPPTLVGNDTGGGLCQIAVTRHPGLAGRLVLTSCDAYDNFPPTFFKVLLAPARFPALARVAFAPLRIHALRRLPIAFGWLMKGALPREVGDSYARPPLVNRDVAADIAAFLKAVSPKDTLAAAEQLRSYDRPVLIAWSREDRFFPPAHAERLAKEIPGARLEWIEDSRTFSPEDQPGRLAELIGAFVTAPADGSSNRGRQASAGPTRARA